LVGEHPVVVASFVGIVVGALATRGLFGKEALSGGVLPMFPAHPAGFFSELVSAFRTTGLGGPLAASPALGAAGGLSWLLFGSTALAQKVLLAGGPAVAAILMYRALARLAGRPGAAVLGAGAYGLSAAVLWAFSEGRLGLLVAMAILPPLVERLEVAFGADEPADGRGRFVAGLGVTLAVGVAFEPGVALAFALIVLVQLALGRARARGLMLSVLAGLAAAGLLFPFLPTLAAGGGRALGSLIGTTDLVRLARLSIGSGSGSWMVAAFLPISAALGLALVGPGLRARALRAAVIALFGLALAWLSSAGWLPAAAANAPIYLTLSAAAEAMLVCFGLASVLGVGRESFGARQIGTALLAVVLGAGLFLQAVSAMVGGWGWGGAEKVPAAWAVVQSAAKGEFNVLWVGEGGRAFPPPGGDPQAVAAAGDATLRYGLTGRDGTLAVDVGRPVVGPGGQALGDALAEILAGRTQHGGALLAPFGIRFIVAGQGTVPAAATARLRAQVDLDPVPALGLVIYRNAAALPPAGALSLPPATAKILSSSDPAVIQQLGQVPSVPFSSVTGGWNGLAPKGSFAYVATQYSGSWRVNGAGASPAFGWATTAPAGGPVAIRYAAQLPRTIEIWLLAVLWLAALWVTRKPVVR